jgi:flagellar biogenesis protein FliO
MAKEAWMPTFADVKRAIAIVLVSCLSVAQAQERYADWRREDEQGVEARTSASPEVDAELEWIEPVSNANAHPIAERKLPFRVAPAPSGLDRSEVIRASAAEPAPRKISKSKNEAPRTTAKHLSPPGRTGFMPLSSAITIAVSLVTVVGLFLIVAWIARGEIPKRPPTLPREALEVLGRQPFGGKQQEIQLIRVGSKLVLVHLLPGHVESLTEISDPVEVDRLTGICYQAHPSGSSRQLPKTTERFDGAKTSSPRSNRRDNDTFDPSVFDEMDRLSSKRHA